MRSTSRVMMLITHAVLPYSLAAERTSMLTNDHKEAVAAFSEKRQPRYRGS